MFRQDRLSLRATCDWSTEQSLALEKVKKVKVGRRRREGWLVMILREFLSRRLRVAKMASANWGRNRVAMVTPSRI